MKRITGPVTALVVTIALSGCAGLGVDPVTLAQAVKLLDEGCQRTVDLNLDRRRPGGGSLRVTRDCPPSSESPPAAEPVKP